MSEHVDLDSNLDPEGLSFTFQNWSDREFTALIKIADNASVIVQGFGEYSILF